MSLIDALDANAYKQSHLWEDWARQHTDYMPPALLKKGEKPQSPGGFGWFHRSGQLADSLTAYNTIEGTHIHCGVGEGMEYAVWIERRKDKGVLQPMIEAMLPSYKASVAEVLKQYGIEVLRNA